MRRAFILILVFCLASVVLLQYLKRDPVQSGSSYSVSSVMRGSNDDSFRKVTGPRAFEFPRDHGMHDDYRTEWWYFTGNLADAAGRAFGYQLTFFRLALNKQLDKQLDDRASAWHSEHVFMAHFAVTDIEGGKFHGFERFNRAGAGLAGAAESSMDVWLDNWSARSPKDREFPINLLASTGEISLELELEQGKAMVLQGDAGLSQKNSVPGNASYYYSFTRMPSSGTVTIGKQQFDVSGLSWMDREWSSSALDQDQIGWDWFSLQLDNNCELMLYRFRRKDGSRDPFSYGVYVPDNAAPIKLGADEFQITTNNTWRSSNSETLYPVGWTIEVPRLGIALNVDAALENQEWNRSFRYWEGAVTFSGDSDGAAVRGTGYVEMTGYAEGENRVVYKQ